MLALTDHANGMDGIESSRRFTRENKHPRVKRHPEMAKDNAAKGYRQCRSWRSLFLIRLSKMPKPDRKGKNSVARGQRRAW